MEDQIADRIYRDPWHLRPHRECFDPLPSLSLNYEMKAIAVRECRSVVSIDFRLDGGDIFSRSGFVVESTLVDGEYINTIFTADCISRRNKNADIGISVTLSEGTTCIGELVAYDNHYNIATIKVKTPMLIPPSRLKDLVDSISLDHNSIDDHPDRFRLFPGDMVVALGCYSRDEMETDIVPGIFSATTPTGFECENLLRAECEIESDSVGGPLINHFGEVIVSLHCNIPRLGLNLKNMFMYPPSYLELVLRTFPNTFTGVVVDKVKSDSLESNEASAKILRIDIIIECDGKTVGGTLELLESIWGKAGEPVELTLLRPRDGCRLHVTINVGIVGPRKLNRWPQFATVTNLQKLSRR
ncbi:hypothetical protein OROHE_020595 [Orobanche hederae]